MVDKLKLCVECKWSVDFGNTPGHPKSSWMCKNPQCGADIDVVDGKARYVPCAYARHAGPSSPCQQDGLFWEAKEM